MRTFRRIAIYCGSSNHVAPPYFEAARGVARHLASRGIDVVYGGGTIGLMGAVADAALAAGAKVHGVIPDKLMNLELGHPGLTELSVTTTMHERKMRMAELSDAFIALPGGWGTLEELFEVTTWTQLGYHEKPVGLLNVAGYYDALVTFMRHAAAEGFVRSKHKDLIQVADTAEELLEKLATCELPKLERTLLEP
jgi:uncharacterized protein (TIGR00730 family)